MPLASPFSVPELVPAGAGSAVVRLPELDNVTLTRRVLALVDHPHFQRLRRVRQLGPTCLVYPGATHTRFEHCLGVYGTVGRYLRSLLQHASVRASLDEEDVLTALVTGLLHDIGHYPFAHTLEAVHRVAPGVTVEVPRHEELAADILRGLAPGLVDVRRPLAALLEERLGVDPERVIRLLTAPAADLSGPVDRLLQSLISSALDADKMDYLWRDSVHLGVPYGRNYDRDRLLNALTVNGAGDGLAITAKGIISAQIFLFCRYTMYSEVYWHHTVRSLSAMLEQVFADIVARERPDPVDLTSRVLAVGDDELLRTLATEVPPQSVAARILACITSDRRRPYKRLVTWSRVYGDAAKLAAYERLYHLDAVGERRLLDGLRQTLVRSGRPLPRGALILDTPPRDKDRTPDVVVHHTRAGQGAAAYGSLAEASHIVSGIGRDFLAAVKKIRLFVHPDHTARLVDEVEARVHDALPPG